MLRRFLCMFYCKTLTHPQLFEAISLSSPPYAAWWNCLSTGSWRWRFFVAPTLSEQGDIAFCLTLSFRTTLCKLLNLLVTCGLYKVLGSYFGCVFLASRTFKQHQVWLSSNRTPPRKGCVLHKKRFLFYFQHNYMLSSDWEVVAFGLSAHLSVCFLLLILDPANYFWHVILVICPNVVQGRFLWVMCRSTLLRRVCLFHLCVCCYYV